MSHPSSQSSRSAYLLLVLTMLLWSTNFVIARAIHGQIGPFGLAFGRWAIALLCLLPFGLPRLARAIHQLGRAPQPDAPKPQALGYPAQSAWQLEVDLSDGDARLGTLRLRLNASAFDALLQNLSGQRPRLGGNADCANFSDRLRIRLDARLLEQELPLGAVLDLRPGSVLSVAMQPHAEVCAQGSPLFRAQVVERQGKLCLSGFADIE